MPSSSKKRQDILAVAAAMGKEAWRMQQAKKRKLKRTKS